MGKHETVISYIAVVAIMLWAAGVASAAKIIYCDGNARESGDGTSWQNSYKHLRQALVDATSSAKPVEIRVARGTYRPDQGAGGTSGDIQAVFLLAGGVTLKGGYAGLDSPDPNVRDVELFPTVLSGDLSGNDSPITIPPRDPYELRWQEPSREDNSLLIVRIGATDGALATTISGVSVVGAHSHDRQVSVYLDSGTAGLYIEREARAIIENCKFMSNTTPGISSTGSNLSVTDCIFKDNVARRCSGGGMQIDGAMPRVVRCLFENNWAWNGGGVYDHADHLQIEDSVFIHNVACGAGCSDIGFGGGLCSEGGSAPTLVRCTFTGNIGATGGAAYWGSTSQFGSGLIPRQRDQVWMVDCRFVANQGGVGGAISAHTSNVKVERSVFCGNSAIELAGAIDNLGSATHFRNCLFSGNRALQSFNRSTQTGGCIMARCMRIGENEWLNFDVAMDNCTLVGNMSLEGRTITCWSSGGRNGDTTVISNCIVDNGGNEILNRAGAQMKIAFTDLRGGRTGLSDPCNAVVWGPGNVDADPLFLRPGRWDPNGTSADANDDFWVDGDYHLKSQTGRWDLNSKSWATDDVTSPCIDAGDPNTPVGDEPQPNGGRINMGAYGGTAEAGKSYPGQSVAKP